MIIHTTTGKTIDTDKLSDVLAAVYEKLDDIHTFFTSLQVPYFLRFQHGGRGSGCQSNLDPTFTPEAVTTSMVGQCIMFIERSMPGVKVQLVVPDDREFPAAS